MAEHDEIIAEIEQELKEDKVYAFLKKYKSYILAGIIAITASIGGFKLYLDYQQTKTEEQSSQRISIEALVLKKDYSQALKLYQDLIKKDGDASSATVLRAANLAAQQGNLDQALKIIKESKSYLKDVHQDLATYLYYLYALDIPSFKIQENELEKLGEKSGDIGYLAREISGLHALKAGDKNKAQEIWTKLKKDLENKDQGSASLKTRLDAYLSTL